VDGCFKSRNLLAPEFTSSCLITRGPLTGEAVLSKRNYWSCRLEATAFTITDSLGSTEW
jgi:hypothetical protein